MTRLLALIVALFPAMGAAQTIDYNIANQTFPAFRADLNDHLEAIVQGNAGTVAPATTFPYMVWVDTSGASPTYKFRNAANSAWVTAFATDATDAGWLGRIITNDATLTGGTIDGMTVGATTPAAGTFTNAQAVNVVARNISGSPQLRFERTLDANTHEQTQIVREANAFQIKTRDSASSLVSTDYSMTIGASGATEHSFRIEGTERLQVTSAGRVIASIAFEAPTAFLGAWNFGNAIFPTTTGTRDIGTTGLRVANIYLTNAPNVSSDERLKHDIAAITAAECRVADAIQIKRYRMNDDPDRIRFGAIAQEVIAAFDAEGLDWRDYAIVTGSEAETYGVAYDELQNLKLACL